MRVLATSHWGPSLSLSLRLPNAKNNDESTMCFEMKVLLGAFQRAFLTHVVGETKTARKGQLNLQFDGFTMFTNL